MAQEQIVSSERTNKDENVCHEEIFSLNHEKWKEYSLKDIALVNPKTGDLPNEFCYIDLESVVSGNLKIKKVISASEAPSRAQRVLNPNDILFQTVRPYQKNNLFFHFEDMDYVASTGYAQIRTNELCTPRFLYYLLHTEKFVNNVLARCTGTSYPAINSNDLKKIKVKIPNLHTQNKIEKILISIDKKIELLEKTHKKLENINFELINKIMEQSYKIPNQDNIWKVMTLKDIGNSYTGLLGKNKDDFNKGNSKFIPYLSIFNDMILDSKNFESVDVKLSEKQNLVAKGDIFFTGSSETPNEVGMSSVLLEDIDNCYLNSFCFGFRLNSFENYNPLFLVYYFRSLKFQKELFKLAQGSTRFNISKKELLKLEIEVPSKSGQDYYANLINCMFTKSKLVNKELFYMKKFKKGLLQKMFI